MPLRITKDATPTRPHVVAEDGLVNGDYAILKLALERAEAECARLRGLIDGLECVHSHGNPNWRCAKLGNVKLCQVCTAKAAADKPDAGEVVDAAGDLC